MNRKLAIKFRTRFNEINKIEIDEVRKSSYTKLFSQLCSAIEIARSLNISFSEGKDIKSSRNRWIKLKKNTFNVQEFQSMSKHIKNSKKEEVTPEGG